MCSIQTGNGPWKEIRYCCCVDLQYTLFLEKHGFTK